jgi:hypothetical protein
MKQFKLILPLSEIPVNAKVTKLTGQNVYTVQDKIFIYRKESEPQVVYADNNTRFIVSESCNITAVSSDTEMVWLCSYYELDDFLDDCRIL